MRVLVVGLNHRVQRVVPSYEGKDWENRERYEAGLRTVIRERKIDLIAEEAGDNTQVAHELQKEEDLWAAILGRQRPQTVEPQDTLAKRVAESLGIPHHDIRPSADEFPLGHGRTVEYEQEMFETTLILASSANSILVLCGDDHRPALAARFTRAGFEPEDRDFAWLSKPAEAC